MDFSNTKSFQTSIYPVNATATSGLLKRVEPFLTPDLLISRFLKGIPLIFRDGSRFTPEELKDRIYLASNETELLLKTTITREAFKEKAPFDRSLYESFIQITTEHGPIISLEHFAIVSADGNNIFEIPASWIEAANFHKRTLNVIPLLAAYGVNQVQGAVGNAGIAFLTILGGLRWVPAFWQVSYTSGLSNTEGSVPAVVNELIGSIAAIEILSEIAATYRFNSQSQSQDGLSQSSSGMGPNTYNKRIEDLSLKRDGLVKKLTGIFSNKFFVSNV